MNWLHSLFRILLPSCCFAALCIGCSSAPETDAQRQARWAQGKLLSWEVENGIGPISKDSKLPTFDGSRTETGHGIFSMKCATCHYLDMPKTGPALRGVTTRRTEAYIINQILNPEQMGKLHPDGKQLVAKYAQFMAVQGISLDDAYALLEFLKSESGKPAVALEKQPGFGIAAPTTTPAAR